MGNILGYKLHLAMERMNTKYVVCVEGKDEDLSNLYKIMSTEEELDIALNNGKMYIICEDNDQAKATAKILNNEDEFYAHLI